MDRKCMDRKKWKRLCSTDENDNMKRRKKITGKIIQMTLSVAMVLVFVLNSFTVIMAEPRTEGTIAYVSNLEDLKTALEDGNVTEIVVENVISLPEGTELNGNGKTVRTANPYITEMGTLSSTGSNHRVFDIASSANVKISNMTIMGGGTSYKGAVNVSSGATLIMDNVTVTRSYRGVNMTSATVVMKDCNIVRNIAEYGGGILCSSGGTLIMDECSLSENRSTSQGGGAMEINGGGKLYANNLVIANNCSGEIGGAINCYKSYVYLINSAVTGNVTTYSAKAGAGVGVNTSEVGGFYAVNCYLADNYYISGGTTSPSDIGLWTNSNIATLINCVYKSVAVDSTATKLTTTDCKNDTENSATGYCNDGILSGASGTTDSFTHPMLLAKENNSNALYVPISPTGSAATGGIITYFDYSDPTNVKMSYGKTNTPLDSLSGAGESCKVTKYFEGSERDLNDSGKIVIGSSATNCEQYYTVKLGSFSKGSVHGATRYGDSYLSRKSVTLRADADSGYTFTRWEKADGTVLSTDNPFTFYVESDITLVPVFITHTHSWKYSRNGSVIEAYCLSAGTGCSYYGTTESHPNALTLSLTANDADYTGRAYNGASVTNNITNVTGAAAGAIEYYKDSEKLSSAPTDAGTYTAKVSIGGVTASSEFTISQVDATYTAPTANSLIYDGTEQSLVSGGTATGGDMYYRLGTDGGWNTSVPTTKNAGDYDVYYYVKGDANHNSIGSESSPIGSVKVKISPKALTKSMVSIEFTEKDYSGSLFKPSVTVSDMSGESNLITENDYEISGTTASSDVGDYTIIVTGKGNYTGTIQRKWSINALSFVASDITANNVITTYDGNEHGIAVSVKKSGVQDVVVRYKDGNGAYTLTECPTYSDAGSVPYTIEYEVKAKGYNAYYGSATVTINQKEVELVWSNTTFTYDRDSHKPTASLTGVVENDTCNVTVNGEQTNAGKNYTATASIDNANYKINASDAYVAFVINPKSITAVVSVSTKDYDGTIAAAVTATADTGITGETLNVIGVTGTFDNKNTGTDKTVTIDSTNAQVTAGAGTNAANYSIIYPKVSTGSIQAISLVIQVNNASKHIGKADPDFSYSITKGTVIEGDNIMGITFERATGETAGTYNITATETAGSNPNYNINITAGTLTIEGHDWSGEWTIIKEATATTDGRKETICTRDGCGQKKYETIPAIGDEEKPENPNVGNLDRYTEIEPDAPIDEATFDNRKSELLDAPAIFTEDEKQQIQLGTDARVWLEVKRTDESSIPTEDREDITKEAEKIMGENPVITYFDADLFKQVEGGDKTQIHEPGIDIQVTILIPDELLNHDRTVVREYKIIRLHYDEVTGESRVDVLSGDFDRETAEFTFKTDKFSGYAIVYTDTRFVTGITLSTDNATLTGSGETIQLTANVVPDNAADKNVIWTSSNPNVAAVDANGKVTAVGNGICTITATTEDGNFTATCTIKVELPGRDNDSNNGDNNNGDNNNDDNNNGGNNSGDNNQSNEDVNTPANTEEDKKPNVETPKTGDAGNVTLWSSLLALYALALVGIRGVKRKKSVLLKNR